MSVKYSLTFAVLSVACLAAWQGGRGVVGWAALPCLCAAVSFMVLSVAYAGAGPRLLFKLASGRRSPWAWVLHWPYFLLNAVSFRSYRMLSREPAFVEVAPNLYLGRRLTNREAIRTPWNYVLDLAAEFAEARPLRIRPGYRSLPILDATAPTEAQLQSAVAWIRESEKAGPVYVHCALGHGRSACIVVAYLLSAGLVGTGSEGVKLVQSKRPGVRLNPAQRRRLNAPGLLGHVRAV
jgi:protein-tyrosine phosphatase